MADKKTVLIADADRTLVGALKANCARLGVNVITAYDTLSAVLKIKESLPDVICLDKDLPGGNGFNVCGMLSFDATKRHFPLIGKEIPIVVLTDWSDSETISVCYDVETYYVPKGEGLWDRIEPLLRQLLADHRRETTPHATVVGDSLDASQESPTAVPGDSADAQRIRSDGESVVSDKSEVKRILVIEDDPSVVEVIRKYVDGTEFQVIPCERPEDAGRLASNAAIVLCDIHMPRARGTFVIRELRQNGFDGPIVVITGDSTPITVMECARSRIDGILLKPFGRKDLIDKLVEIAASATANESHNKASRALTPTETTLSESRG